MDTLTDPRIIAAVDAVITALSTLKTREEALTVLGTVAVICELPLMKQALAREGLYVTGSWAP